MEVISQLLPREVVTLPLQMDEQGLRALHESLVPAI